MTNLTRVLLPNPCTTEKFKSDDEVQISAEDKDIDAEVDIFLNKKICKMFCSVTCSEGWY